MRRAPVSLGSCPTANPKSLTPNIPFTLSQDLMISDSEKHGGPRDSSTVPHFVIGGAAKAGTTWLHACLNDNPHIYLPPEKEIHYFSYHFDKGVDWYQKKFKRSTKVTGDVSPSYLPHPEAAKRIAQFAPNTKFVFVLREPVARAYSHYCMLLSSGVAGPDIDAVLVESSRYVQEGFYFRHLSRYFDHFDPSCIQVFLHSELAKSPEVVIKSISEHIGVPFVDSSLIRERFFERKPLKKHVGFHQFLVQNLAKPIQASTLGNRVLTLLRRSSLAKAYHSMSPTTEYPKLTPELQQRIQGYLRADTESLQTLINRDLSSWLAFDTAIPN